MFRIAVQTESSQRKPMSGGRPPAGRQAKPSAPHDLFAAVGDPERESSCSFDPDRISLRETYPYPSSSHPEANLTPPASGTGSVCTVAHGCHNEHATLNRAEAGSSEELKEGKRRKGEGRGGEGRGRGGGGEGDEPSTVEFYGSFV